MKRIFISFIFLLFVVYVQSGPLHHCANAVHPEMDDTLRIHQLFKDGYTFIDGPSDSLLYYFEKALVIINSNLDELNASASKDQEQIDVFTALKIRVYIEYGIEYFFKSEYISALEYYREALKYAIELNDQETISECYSEIGIVLKNQGKLDEALENYKNKTFIKELDSWIASCLVNIGNVYKEKDYLIISLRYYLEALETLEKIGHTRRIAVCYQNIGELYSKQKEYDKALTYYQSALRLSEQNNDKEREKACYLNIGYVWAERNDFNKAREYYNQALKYYEESGYTHEMDDCYIMIGDAWLDENQPEEAISYYLKAEKISMQEEDFKVLSEIFCKMGKVYFLLNNLDLALDYCNKCIVLAKQTSSIEIESNAHSILSDIFLKKDQIEKSLYHFKIHSHLKDSIFNANKYRAMTEMGIKYETEKKENKIALYEEQSRVQKLELTQKNRLMMVVALGTMMILVIIFLLYRQGKMKTRQKAAILEQKLLRSQMNPHFIFNSLVAIQSYIYKNEAVLAGDFLARFAELIRFTLESSRNEFLSLEKEIKMMRVYLELQKLRFDNLFNYELLVDDKLETEHSSIPPMFAQPFVENAIEHGLRHLEQGGLIRIRYQQLNKCCVRITISDNGVGRTKSMQMEEKAKHQSMAIEITKERLEILSGKFKRDYSFQIKDLKDSEGKDAGVEVMIDIPIH